MAATPTKKSAAYEAGLREGRADKSKKPKIEIEISPEGEEEEGPEGEEEMDGASAKAKPPSRKRSAKNAKTTKAPMDGGMYGKKPMDGEGCGCGAKGRKGKAACDGSCGGMKRDRADSALTPHEYLAACELGIQDRSRPYIRARLDTAMNLTPSTIRNDLKCGRGSISPGEKCTKGAATKAENKVVNKAGVKAKDKYSFKKQQKAWGQYAQMGIGVVGGLVGATSPGGGGVAGALGRGVIGAAAGAGIGRVLGTAEGTLRAAGNRTARAYSRNRENGRRAQEGIRKLNPKLKAEYASAKARGASKKELMQLSIQQAARIGNELDKAQTKVWTNSNEKMYSKGTPYARSLRGRRDSIYAAGFTADLAQLAI